MTSRVSSKNKGKKPKGKIVLKNKLTKKKTKKRDKEKENSVALDHCTTVTSLSSCNAPLH